jgi:U2-associated protein SR140
MTLRFSLAKGGKAQLNAKAKAEEEEKEREEKLALEKVMADFEEEHSGRKGKGILGESKQDHSEEEDVFVPTGSKRHFTGRQRSMKSGPGTLEPEPFNSFSRQGPGGRPQSQAQPRFGGGAPGRSTALEGPRQTENVYTTLVAKASNLPPTIDPLQVAALFAEFPALKVTKVEKVPPQGPTGLMRPSATMKVVFDKDASARDLDEAMLKLNDKKYLGRGYYLHLDRYLGGKVAETTQVPLPFGARWEVPEAPKGYAPPPDLGGGSKDGPRDDRRQLVVNVELPPDIATIRLIHQTIEQVIEGGIEFEAALMDIPRIQEEERFAWLYDQKHPLNRYYRWKMHQLVTGGDNQEIFEGIIWRGPTETIPDEFAVEIGDLEPMEEDSDSDEEDQKPQHKPLAIGDDYPGRDNNGFGILTPYWRAFLIWMFNTLPPGVINLGNLAAFAQFAVEHATAGMDEVVELLITNIVAPFQLSEDKPNYCGYYPEDKDDTRRPDVREVTLNAFRIVHDVLFTTSKQSGAAYKYRQYIGTQLVERKIIEYMEQLPTQLGMGRMTERSYREDVNSMLKVWEHESLFDKAMLEHFDEVFNGRERQKEQEDYERKVAERRKNQVVPKATSAEKEEMAQDNEAEGMDMDIDKEQTPDAQGEDAIIEDSAPEILNHSSTSEPPEVAAQPGPARASAPDEIPGETAAARARRLRPKAEDMFASDEE